MTLMLISHLFAFQADGLHQYEFYELVARLIIWSIHLRHKLESSLPITQSMLGWKHTVLCIFVIVIDIPAT